MRRLKLIISDEEIECFKFTGTEFFNTHAGPYKYFIHLLRKYAYINKKQIINTSNEGIHDFKSLDYVREFTEPGTVTEYERYFEVVLNFSQRFGCKIHIHKDSSLCNRLQITDSFEKPGYNAKFYYLHDPYSTIDVSDKQTIFLLRNSKSISNSLKTYEDVINEVRDFKIKIKNIFEEEMKKYNFTGWFFPNPRKDYKTMKEHRALTYLYGEIEKIDENDVIYFKEEKEILIPIYNYLSSLESIKSEMEKAFCGN